MSERILVDNNIVIPLFLSLPDSDAARRLFQKFPHWVTESFELIELSNVLMTYVRNNHIELREAERALDKVVGVFGSHGLYTVDLKDSLRMAARFGTSTYDARYLVLADRLGLKLVTQDKRLRGAAPELTQSLEEAVAL